LAGGSAAPEFAIIQIRPTNKTTWGFRTVDLLITRGALQI
jgi:hypothetical protein